MRVIINLQYSDGTHMFSSDLEVPATICARDLSNWLAKALKIDDDNAFIYQHTLSAPLLDNRPLLETETLASVGLWNGSKLILKSRRIGRKEKVEEISTGKGKKTEAFLESERRKYFIDGSIVWIGRSTPQTSSGELKTLIDLKDEPRGDTVSRKHAQIIIKDDKYFLKIPKKNISRTFINGENIKSDELQLINNSDTLKFGAVILQFRLHDTETP